MPRELERPVIAVAQLSRKVETRSTKDYTPRLSDLRESGSIEQDADVVMFVYRPEYYHLDYIDIEGQKKESKGVAEIVIANQRNGPTGSIYMHFEKMNTSFSALDLSEVPDYLGDERRKDEDDKPWDVMFTAKRKNLAKLRDIEEKSFFL
jgi:replicative DNA helicase